LIRVPALEFANEHFAVVVASYLALSGRQVTADAKQAIDLVRRVGEGLDMRSTAAEIRTWTAG
jgi:hypothetical protein